MGELTFEELCNELRAACRNTEVDVRALKEHELFDDEMTFPQQYGEMKANIMLALRHLEDARMRLGKVIQYSQDGVSCFDK